MTNEFFSQQREVVWYPCRYRMPRLGEGPHTSSRSLTALPGFLFISIGLYGSYQILEDSVVIVKRLPSTIL